MLHSPIELSNLRLYLPLLLYQMEPCRKNSENTLSRKAILKHPLQRLTRRHGALALLTTLLLSSACSPDNSQRAATAEPLPDSLAVAPPAEAPAPEQDTLAIAPAPATAAPVAAEDWNYPGPVPAAGAVLPQQRIIAYYGNLYSKRMGILGELPQEQMLARLDEEVARWSAADSLTPVKPALHLIAVTAQGQPGRAGKYRLRMPFKMIDQVLEMAKTRDALVFLDIQVGHSTLQEEVPALAEYLKLPNVHLGIDAEFSMKGGSVPGRRIGTFDAEDINYVTEYLAKLAQEHNIPPKILVVHRFTQGMITNYEQIALHPEVQVVMHMDGWGHPALKKDTYRRYIVKEPVQFTGFKVFYKNDLRKSPRIMSPDEILALDPKPLYIQYQ